MAEKPTMEIKQELVAMDAVHAALRELEPEVQERVLIWVAKVLNIDHARGDPSSHHRAEEQRDGASGANAEHERGDTDGILDGISAVAKKWIARNGLQPKKLATMFSLGGEEVDLIANTVPGKNKKDRMRSVFLMKGVAAYLGTGVARFTHEQMKEACLHYDAFDAGNFAIYFKSLLSEVAGNKETGYTLTPRGLAAATEMVKTISEP
jgi:hypothetical protein